MRAGRPGPRHGAVSLLELVSGWATLPLVAGVGWRPGSSASWPPELNRRQAGYTIATGGPVIVRDYPLRSASRSTGAHRAWGLSGMSVRIGDAKEALWRPGRLHPARDRFTRDDANFLQAMANVLAAAVNGTGPRPSCASRDQLAAIVGHIDEGITVLTTSGCSSPTTPRPDCPASSAAQEMAAMPQTRKETGALRALRREPSAFAARRGPAQPPGDGRGADHAERVVGFRVKA